MNRFTLSVVFCLCLPAFCFCQSATGGKPKTNLELFEECISGGLEKFIYYPGVNRDFQFIFIVNPENQDGTNDSSETEARFLTGVIKKTASSNKITFSFAKERESAKSDSNYYLLMLQVHKLETRYAGFKKNKFLGEKTLARRIHVKIAVNMLSYDKKFDLNDFITASREDEISFDGYENLESSQYYFTRSEPPGVGVFERLIFPVVLIIVTAVTTILFFVIRSK